MSQIRVSRSVITRIRTMDLPIADILRQAELPANLLQQEHIRLSVEQWFALWRSLTAHLDDPTIGLQVSRLLQNEPYDPLWITALSANSFQDALEKIGRYKRLFSAEEISLTQQGQHWHIEISWLSEQTPPAILLDATFAHMLELGRRGTGRNIHPARVLFQRQESDRAVYEQFFQCPIEFGAANNLLIFKDEDIKLPFKSANPELLALIEPQLEAELQPHSSPQRFVEQVAELLLKRIAGNSPTIHDIAQELHISARTLQRRLAEEGVHFQQLLEQVRLKLAKTYLQASKLELTEIAFLLGYQEPTSFHRAFQQWEGQPPGQWRIAHQQHSA